MRKLLQRIASNRPARHIDSDGNKYLYRVYLAHFGGWRIYLHKFVGADGDRWLHDHPFNALSIILAGSYKEKILTAFDCKELKTKTKKRRFLNFINSNKFHQIGGIEGETWTLFIHAPHRKQWGFLQEEGSCVIYHNPFDQSMSDGNHWWKDAPSLEVLEGES